MVKDQTRHSTHGRQEIKCLPLSRAMRGTAGKLVFNRPTYQTSDREPKATELLRVEISSSCLGCLIKSLHLFPKNFISSLRIALGVSHCLCVYVIYWTHISVGNLAEDFSFCHIFLTYRIYTGYLEFFHSNLLGEGNLCLPLLYY